jgi:DnaK suppressor protein
MFTVEFIKNITNILNDSRKQLIQTCKEQDIEVDVDGDEVDEMQGHLLIDMQTKLTRRNIEKLDKIDGALSRIHNNVYGLCIDCEEEIPEKRLLFNPCVETCVDCAEDREIAIKKEKL